VSLISKLKAVVAGDEYLDDDFDELDYASEDELNDINNFKQNPKNANVLANSNPFDFMNNNRSSKVVGMPGISNSSSEVSLMEPRSFDEMPQAIQALRRKKNCNTQFNYDGSLIKLKERLILLLGAHMQLMDIKRESVKVFFFLLQVV